MSNVAIYTQAKNDMPEKDSDSYGTPQWLFAWLDDEYDFDVDICASDINHKCDKYYTLDNTSVGKDWSEMGSVAFCNPPFSRGKKEVLWHEAYRNMKENGVSTVFVVPADDCNIAWHEHIFGKATKITKIVGRVKFDVPHQPGVESNGAIGVAVVEFMSGEEPCGYEQGYVHRDTVRAVFEK